MGPARGPDPYAHLIPAGGWLPSRSSPHRQLSADKLRTAVALFAGTVFRGFSARSARRAGAGRFALPMKDRQFPSTTWFDRTRYIVLCWSGTRRPVSLTPLDPETALADLERQNLCGVFLSPLPRTEHHCACWNKS